MKVNLAEIEVGDIFSEESHYIVKEVKVWTWILRELRRRQVKDW